MPDTQTFCEFGPQFESPGFIQSRDRNSHIKNEDHAMHGYVA